MANSIGARSTSTPKKVSTLPHCYWHNLSGVKETILREYWHPALSPTDALSRMLTTTAHTFPHCSPQTHIQLGSTQSRISELTRTPITCKPVVFFLSFSMHLYSLHLSISLSMVWFPWKQRLWGEKKEYCIKSEWVIFFFHLSLSLFSSCFPSLCLSPSLPRSLKVKQCAERSISLINTTQQHSALRGEMKRHGGMSTCRPGVVLTNDTYHTSHGWEQGRGRRDRERLERERDR